MQRSASQVPNKNALDGHDDIGAIRCHGLEKRLQAGLHVLVEPDLPSSVQGTGPRAPGSQIDATIDVVPFSVKLYGVSSSAEAAKGGDFSVMVFRAMRRREGAWRGRQADVKRAGLGHG